MHGAITNKLAFLQKSKTATAQRVPAKTALRTRIQPRTMASVELPFREVWLGNGDYDDLTSATATDLEIIQGLRLLDAENISRYSEIVSKFIYSGSNTNFHFS